MYLGIDIGGTKTLVAVLDEHGVVREEYKFLTPKDYDQFVIELEKAAALLETKAFKAAGIGIPGRLNHDRTETIELGNLGWKNHPIKADVENLLGCPVFIENDANLAGLSEAMLHQEFSTVLYFTISTGIGTGIVHDQQLDPGLLDSEGGHILLPHNGEWTRWEKFASGKAIFEHFGKKAMDIPASDTETWRHIVRNLTLGFIEHIAIIQPDLIIIGGGVGTYFDRFKTLLHEELDHYKEVSKVSYVRFPEIVQAQRPEQAVIYGCYDLAKQKLRD
jgi:predicted NBD/HSP70 family sugar kinase